MTTIAIIGTAGRDKSIPMTPALWSWMLADAAGRTSQEDHLVSGGAAWADHLAVALFLKARAASLTLHLPAPFVEHLFVGPQGSAASAANYYHQRFSQVIGADTLQHVARALRTENCNSTFEPVARGYRAMFARNRKVAAAVADGLVLAYTFGEGDVPADGGTKDTWDQCKGRRIHIALPRTGLSPTPPGR